MGATKAAKREHWYHLSIDECVLCGRYDEIRTRIYGKKPKDWKKRYKFMQSACAGHFM